jgi:hypothetical protein
LDIQNFSGTAEMKYRVNDDPFSLWAEGVNRDLENRIEESHDKFIAAAKSFFDSAASNSEVATACYEYSTLMDAYSTVQKGRKLIAGEEFESALDCIAKAGEIFRSTIHFAFLSPFVAASAGLEVLQDLDDSDPEKFQACKNSIALFEQSKIVLSFRDEHHPIIDLIDAYIRLAISKALRIEALQEKTSYKDSDSQEKIARSDNLDQEFRTRLEKLGRTNYRLDFFPVSDYERAQRSSFLIGYPSGDNLSLLNVGTSPALVRRVGNIETQQVIAPKSNLQIPLRQLEKMKIRVIYRDLKSGNDYDEGCLSLL